MLSRRLWHYKHSAYFSLIIVTSCLMSNVLLVDPTDFYPYITASPFKETFVHFDLAIPFPHWADAANKKVDVVNCGIVRFSGLDGLNTLDLLVLATSLPYASKTDNIFYERVTPGQDMKDKIRSGMKDAQLPLYEEFEAKEVLIFTWIDVQFYINKESTFQVAVASSDNRTIAIVHIAKMNIPDTLTFYPELDLRYAYEGGTKFIRAGVMNSTGFSTATKFTNIVAVDNSNSGLNGRWVLDLSSVNVTEEEDSTSPTATPAPLSDFTNSSSLGLAGQFVFDQLSLDNNLLTSAGNNDEISVVLAKKDADPRYEKLNTNIKVWVSKVYKTATNVSDASVEILSYKPGSLIVEYSVQLTGNMAEVCAEDEADDCLRKVEDEVKLASKSDTVTSGELSGKLDETKTTVKDFDECSTSNAGKFCDINAYCVNYPGELTHACRCMDGYKGDGFPGNCKKDQESAVSQNMAVIGGSAGAAAFCIIAIVAIVCYIKRKEKKNWAFRRLALEQAVPADMRPTSDKDKKKKGRSTRKMMVAAPYGRDFDIYHRTPTSY